MQQAVYVGVSFVVRRGVRKALVGSRAVQMVAQKIVHWGVVLMMVVVQKVG